MVMVSPEGKPRTRGRPVATGEPATATARTQRVKSRGNGEGSIYQVKDGTWRGAIAWTDPEVAGCSARSSVAAPPPRSATS